ncbi:uncharacterized protein MELLADRAFT_112678 [Melampsora larici-populina 98AG31]|uniref:Uncharacterized protein n=1 Tax=Melampsora larici-populina (strain 98AG31 / pathotype 3-4-7) TaxID=747676 RepID=F4S790_MELLP|nr:uncharacterized protein MELLADRAFT_112678 [Melampsora larici-populina 98AG31]EGF99473.1 hypothetical protein MELLADRAFT_112678 [Melampsora larici-populina 98AG31]
MGDIERRPPIFMGSFFLGHPRSDYKPYDHKSALTAAAKAGTYTGLAGSIVSAIHHGVISPVEGYKGYFANVTKFTAMAAAVGFTYGGVSETVAGLRDENDPWNAAAGGCAAGFILGVRAGHLPMALGNCALWGTAAGGFNYAGATLIPAHIRLSKAEQQAMRLEILGEPKNPLSTQ